MYKDLPEGMKDLKNFGERCDCEEPDFEEFIWQGEVSEIHTLCVECGGYRE